MLTQANCQKMQEVNFIHLPNCITQKETNSSKGENTMNDQCNTITELKPHYQFNPTLDQHNQQTTWINQERILQKLDYIISLIKDGTLQLDNQIGQKEYGLTSSSPIPTSTVNSMNKTYSQKFPMIINAKIISVKHKINVTF